MYCINWASTIEELKKTAAAVIENIILLLRLVSSVGLKDAGLFLLERKVLGLRTASQSSSQADGFCNK